MTDADRVSALLDAQRMLVARLERVARLADTMAEQLGYGGLVANIRHGLEGIANHAREGID